ncbi:MAG: FMN-binding protein [Lachnospiraceae bacterium]|nr:FMN-binding protein [Lachnospiraceae bacterium]
MKYANFVLKSVCLVLMIGVLWQYQSIAQARAAVVAENEAAIAEMEEYNAQLLAAEEESEEGAGYQDGIYEGEGTGFGGTITVSVTVEDGLIADITVLSAAGEDTAYYNTAQSVLDDILEAQSTEVDTVSGATFTSGGLIEAVSDALGKAVE